MVDVPFLPFPEEPDKSVFKEIDKILADEGLLLDIASSMGIPAEYLRAPAGMNAEQLFRQAEEFERRLFGPRRETSK